MSDHRTILNDPREILRAFPGLKNALGAWITKTHPTGWNERHTAAFLAFYGYEVGPMPQASGRPLCCHVWAAGACVKTICAQGGDGLKVAMMSAYRAALGLLERRLTGGDADVDFYAMGEADRVKIETKSL